MNNKSKVLLNLIIALIFLAVLVFGFFSVFSLKTVDAEFSVAYGREYSADIQKKLEGYKNKNLLFLKTEEIGGIFGDYPYLEVTELKKVYPSTLRVAVKERQEIYKLTVGEDYYVIDDAGNVLAKNFSYGDKLIELGGVTVLRAAVGEKLGVEETELLSAVFEMSAVGLYTNNIEGIEIDYGLEKSDVVFRMRTGVNVTVTKALDDGIAKMEKAMQAYDAADDYVKSTNDILVVKTDEGEIKATWTSHNA